MASSEDQLECFNENAILIQRSPTDRGFRLETSQLLPYPRERVFELFSDAFRLEAITPAWLHFHVVTPRPIQIVDYGVYGGALINTLAVRRDLLKIFAFRRRKIAEAFPALAPG